MLYDGCSILSDINYILGSYRTAYRWRSLAYEIDSSTDEIVQDMITIAQMSGITKNLELYIKQYLALCPNHKESDLCLGVEAKNDNTLLLLDKLNMFRPKEVIETIMDEDDAELRLIKTLAYGASQDFDVFMERIRRHINEGGELGCRHLYYFPLPILDSACFWNLIVEHKPQIATMSCELCTLIASVKFPSDFQLNHTEEFEAMTPFLHLARCEQDIEKMEELAHEYPIWKDPALCVRFFKSHDKMPKWKEFYCLEELDSKYFLAKKRPERFE